MLGFFKKFLEEDCKCEEIKIGKNEKIKISPFKDPFPKNVIPSGFLVTNHRPNPNKFCDLENCTINDSNHKVLNCGHSFHEICIGAMDSGCVYCMEFYTKKINEITLSDVDGDVDDDNDNYNENIEEEDDDDDDGIDNNYIFNNDHYIQMINELRILANVNDNDSPTTKKRKNSS